MQLILATIFIFPWIGVAEAVSDTEPPPTPSGMDLLYSDQVAFLPSGEPIVTLGLMTGKKQVILRADKPLQADFYEAGVFKQTTVRAGDSIEVTIERSQPAKRRFFIDLMGVPTTGVQLDSNLKLWQERGFSQVTAIEQGALLGIGGRVIDNREYRLVIPIPKPSAATKILSTVFEKYAVRGFISSRIDERPWAQLNIQSKSTPLGKATSFVRFVALGGHVQVDAVEHGLGYSWHGFQDRTYRGEIYVVVDSDGLLAAVNVVGTEAVLAGVVPAELFASSPIEALKAQAVAARNQILAKLGKKHHTDPFHLCSEQHCQVYAGISKEDPRTTAAIRATFGEALFLENRLVDTVYSSSCGGHTENNEIVWGNTPDPALRGRPDFDVKDFPDSQNFFPGITPISINAWVNSSPKTYCSKASKTQPEKFRWRRKFSINEISALLEKNYPTLGQLKRLVVEKRGPSGRAETLLMEGTDGTDRVLHELPIRKLFKNLNSAAFVIEHEYNAKSELMAVTFSGAGWGHGVGMCQMGAIGRAEAGQNYRQILEHYYNKASVESLYLDKPNRNRNTTVNSKPNSFMHPKF